MPNVSPEITQPTETQRAETAANRFFDMAKRAKVGDLAVWNDMMALLREIQRLKK